MVAVVVQRLRAILDRRLDLDFDDVAKLLLVDRRFTAITGIMNHDLFLNKIGGLDR